MLQKEIDETDGENILDKIRNMQFLDYCLKETLRLFPPVPFFAREFDEDTIIDGVKIYKNTDVVINIAMLHRNEKYWKNPDEFNPYRFTDDEVKTRDSFCYVPFSAGPRNCIGQRFALIESKIIIYHILKNFNLKIKIQVCIKKIITTM